MFDLATVATVFVLVFLAELGDKTQLVAFSLTATARSPWPVFWGASCALVLSSLLAALIGGAAGDIFPREIVGHVSAALFVVFGVMMLIEREVPPIKQAFLDALVLESEGARLMRKVLAACPDRDAAAISVEISADESSHEALFRLLLKGKRFFCDDINEADALAGIAAGLTLRKNLRRLPVADALAELVRVERACRCFYEFFLSHLACGHHDEPELEAELRRMIAEESRHEKLLDGLRQRMGR